MLDETTTLLEMTAPIELVAARRPPKAIDLEEVGPVAAALVRETYLRIWAPQGGGGRVAWSDRDWADELERRGVRAWIARVDTEVAGLLELDVDDETAGIVVIGLVPAYVGRGFGGPLLTVATQLAWRLAPRVDRVLVQTSSRDHPHALPNYERRGFRVVRA